VNAVALITAAGSSSRLGARMGKKEYLELGGRRILSRTCAAFYDSGLFTQIYVTLPPGDEEEARKFLIEDGFPEEAVGEGGMILVPGGDTRQKSVRAGLEAVAARSGNCAAFPEVILIHDGARPWISTKLIEAVLEGARRHGGCAPVLSPPDAIKTVDEAGFITSHAGRDRTLGVQTPQGFDFPRILEAHRRAGSDGAVYIDDTEIFERYAGRVYTVPGDPRNRKITYPHDVDPGI
jgi:2-C-methyl-D-erythritol 4-phosphate cytidylyltransferase